MHAYSHHNRPESPDGSPSPSIHMGPKAKDRSTSASKTLKSAGRSALSRPVSSAAAVATPSRSSSQQGFCVALQAFWYGWVALGVFGILLGDDVFFAYTMSFWGG